MMAATTVAARMFRFIHCYGNITIADGRDGVGNSFAPCNALPKGSRPKAAFCVLIKIKGGKRLMTIYIITFQTYGTGEFQVSYNVFSKRKDAELEARELRSNGHTQVTVIKREVRF